MATLVDLIERGVPTARAAAIAGIGKATFYRWLDAGRPDKAPKQYRDFRDTLTRARARAEAAAIEDIRAWAEGFKHEETRAVTFADGSTEVTITTKTIRDWRAAAFLLERMFPKRWGRRAFVMEPMLPKLDTGPKRIRMPIAGPSEAA